MAPDGSDLGRAQEREVQDLHQANVQFHGVIKRHLEPTIQDINRALLGTLAACGDVNRSVSFARSLWSPVYLILLQERASFGHSGTFRTTRPSLLVHKALQRTFDPAN